MLKVVVSGVSMVQGGILSVLKDVLTSFSRLQADNEISVTALVHDKELVADCGGTFLALAFPDVKSSWSKRLRFEYATSKKISEDLKPDLWISLHDMTPNVSCPVRVVYCHNPSPFYKTPVGKYFFYDTTFSLFTLFYRYLYGINIHKNKYVIVQQNWIRRAFSKMYGVNCIVSYPVCSRIERKDQGCGTLRFKTELGRPVFFYPTFPRVFKNIECVCRAAELLSKVYPNFELIITIDGSENKYSVKIYNDFKHVKQIKFIGIQPRQIIEAMYGYADCLVFPSKLETWGLPLSEFALYHKPILAADLPYAHETIGAYELAKYFKTDSPDQLAMQMEDVINNSLVPDLNYTEKPSEPFFESWDELLLFLLENTKNIAKEVN